MMRVCTSLAAGILSLCLAASAAAETLREAVFEVLGSSPEIRTAQANRRAVDQELQRAGAGLKPTLEADAGAGYELTDSRGTRERERLQNGSENFEDFRSEAGLTLRQMLFDGFDVVRQIDRAAARVESAAHRVQETAQFQALRAVEVYLEVLRREALVQLAEENFAVHAEVLKKSRERAEIGAGRRADVDQAQARHARARSALIANRGDLKAARHNYLRVVGHAPGTLSDPRPPRPSLPGNMQQALVQSLENHPSMQVAQADVRGADAEARRAESLFLPRLDLELGGARRKNFEGVSGDRSELLALLRLRYNLYRGGADVAQRREALERRNEALHVLATTRRLIEEDVRVSWDALGTAEERLPALRAHVDAADRVRFAYREQFDIGQRTLLDLLDSENELFAAQSALVSGEYTALFGLYRVLASTGQLIDSIEVELPPEADPEAAEFCVGVLRLAPTCALE